MGCQAMVTTTRAIPRPWRSCGVVASAVALAAVSLVGPTPPAHAADPITAADQPYFAFYHLDQARAKGYTGAGVTIAMIDGQVDGSVPELVGATITSKTQCTIRSSPEVTSHGTGTAAILVSRNYGVAPDASLLTYQATFGANGDTGENDCRDTSGARRDSYPWLLNAAMNDGAQIINVSASSPNEYKELRWVAARAMKHGVLIVGAAGNDARNDDASSLSLWSGVIGVSAISLDGSRQDYSSWGQGVTTAAVGGPVVERNIATGGHETVQGTSVSAPIVAGTLALARQKWPNATSNQLLQLLVKTGLNPDHGWNQYTGYGAIDPAAMVNTDPSQFPDENPLADKGGGSSPTREEVQQYADGVVDPTQIVNDNSYTYRGLDESKLTDPMNTSVTHLGTSPRYHAK